MFFRSCGCSLLLIFILVNFSLAQTQEMQFLTLDQSLEIAFKNNKSLLQEKEKIESAKFKVDETRSNFYPQLSFSGSYTYLGVVPSFTFAFPGAPEEKVETGFHDNFNLGLSLQQPLFTWGKIRNSYHISQLGYQIYQEEYNRVKQEVKYQVESSFYLILLAEKLVEVREQALKNLEEHLKTVEARFKAGQASEFEVLRAKVQRTNAIPPLTQAKNSKDLALDAYKNLLGLDLKTNIKLLGELKFEPEDFKLEKSEIIALKQRPEIRSINIQKKIASKSLSIAKANNKPALYGVANYSYQNPFYSVQEWDYDWHVGLLVNINLFDGFATRSKVAQAKSSINELDIIQKQIQEGIKLEVSQAISDINLAKENIFSQGENVTQAEKALEIAKVQYAEGVITSLEEMDTQLALTIAQTNYLQALADYLVARVRYYKAIGEE
ncbi:MAG: TolC family protein [Candidatus Zixiibacteriota bacterium]